MTPVPPTPVTNQVKLRLQLLGQYGRVMSDRKRRRYPPSAPGFPCAANSPFQGSQSSGGNRFRQEKSCCSFGQVDLAPCGPSSVSSRLDALFFRQVAFERANRRSLRQAPGLMKASVWVLHLDRCLRRRVFSVHRFARRSSTDYGL